MAIPNNRNKMFMATVINLLLVIAFKVYGIAEYKHISFEYAIEMASAFIDDLSKE